MDKYLSIQFEKNISGGYLCQILQQSYKNGVIYCGNNIVLESYSFPNLECGTFFLRGMSRRLDNNILNIDQESHKYIAKALLYI